MKGSMLNKMHGTREQKFATLRALYAYMWAHPGKKLLFMGAELGQWREWSDERSLDWHLLDEDEHLGVNTLVRDLNRLLKEQPALYELDVEPRGFQWIDVDNAIENVVAFQRLSRDGDSLVCVCNFSAAPRRVYRFGLPERGTYRLLLNTDSSYYSGSNALQINSIEAEDQPWPNEAKSSESEDAKHDCSEAKVDEKDKKETQSREKEAKSREKDTKYVAKKPSKRTAKGAARRAPRKKAE